MNQKKDNTQDELETLDGLEGIRTGLKAGIIVVGGRTRLPGELADSVKELETVQVTRLR
jgi:hypothetical protein